MLDADRILSAARRPLVIGIGGGGDVVGALAAAESCRATGTEPVLGGVTWERRAIDPDPGPRTLQEIVDVETLPRGGLLARPETRTRASGIPFAEARLAGVLGEPVVMIDPNAGPAAAAEAIAGAMEARGCDLVLGVDVGGDVLAHGDEPGLLSPLCDAVMLAAIARVADAGVPALCGIVGAGCDAELTPDEVLERIAELGAAGALAGARAISPRIAARMDEAIAAVPTEASALAVRCARGETGPVPIRGGRSTAQLSPLGALIFLFDPRIARDRVARLTQAVSDARDLEHANELLHALGVRTELDLEREFAARGGGSS